MKEATAFAKGSIAHLLFSAREHAKLTVDQLGRRMLLQMRWHERIFNNWWCQPWFIEQAEGRRGDTAGYTERYVQIVLSACELPEDWRAELSNFRVDD